jgi:biopolymer transport protein ExbD
MRWVPATLAVAVLLACQGCGPKSSQAVKRGTITIAVDKNGTVTYTGDDVTCAQVEAAMAKLEKTYGKNHVRIPSCTERVPSKPDHH